jgi:hypothetical protein
VLTSTPGSKPSNAAAKYGDDRLERRDLTSRTETLAQRAGSGPNRGDPSGSFVGSPNVHAAQEAEAGGHGAGERDKRRASAQRLVRHRQQTLEDLHQLPAQLGRLLKSALVIVVQLLGRDALVLGAEVGQ